MKDELVEDKSLEYDELVFEDELELLKDALKQIENTDVTVTQSIDAYEKGVEHYNNCKKMLEDAELRVKEIQDKL